jgi:hypothetical protein
MSPSTSMHKLQIDALIREWRLGEHSRKLERCARSILTQLGDISLFTLRCDPRLQVEVRRSDDPWIWASFPVHKRRLVAQGVELKPTARVLLSICVPGDEVHRWPAKYVEDHLPDHVGHTLLYLRNPKARNECVDAEKEWNACRT